MARPSIPMNLFAFFSCWSSSPRTQLDHVRDALDFRTSPLVARSYAVLSSSALATTNAPVMVANNSAAPFDERPPATNLSRHILKKRLTSVATSLGKPNDTAPTTVAGHI